MTEEFEDMIEEVEDEVVEESQSSADPINTEEVVEEDELIVTDEMLDTIAAERTKGVFHVKHSLESVRSSAFSWDASSSLCV